MIQFIKSIKKSTIIGNEVKEIHQEPKRRRLTLPIIDEDERASTSGYSQAARSFHQNEITTNVISSHDYKESLTIYGRRQNSTFGTRTVEFSNDGSWFVSGCYDGRVLLWPTTKALDNQWTPNPIEMKEKHDMNSVTCLAMSSDNSRILSGGLDDKILIHDITTYKYLYYLIIIVYSFNSYFFLRLID